MARTRRGMAREQEALTASATAATGATAQATITPGRPSRLHPSTADAIASAYHQTSKVLAEVNEGFTAAAMLMDPATQGNQGQGTPNAVTRTWQHAAWGYVHSVPELNAGKMYVGNCFSRCTLTVGKRNPDGTIEQAFDGENPAEGVDGDIADEAAALIHDLRAKVGGSSELMRSFGEKVFVAGELYMVPEDTPSGTYWECLSTQELMPEGDHFTRYYGPGWGEDPLPPTTKPLRVWRPDSQYGRLADSSVRSCLEILEELVVLTRLVRASAISRMALSGILVLPDELDTPDDDEAPDGGQAESKNPLAVDIINTGAKAIDDPASAAAFMPYVLQGPREYLEGVRHVPFQTDDQENTIKRTEALQRLAQGLDLPVEVILGHQSTTFANAAQVSIDTFNIHIEPGLALLCDALTVGYLWPAMAAARGIDAEHLKDTPYPAEIMTVAVTYDASKLISRPDRLKEMADVFEKDLTFTTIRISEMREALGLDPEQAPDDQEVAMRINAYRLARIREVVDANPAAAAVPVADASAGKATAPSSDPTNKASTAQGNPSASQQAATDREAASGFSLTERVVMLETVRPELRPPAPNPIIDATLYLAERIAGAMELTIDRSVEKVGSKIRAKARSATFTQDDRDRINGIGNVQVPTTLGREAVERIIGAQAEETMVAEVRGLERRVQQWAQETGMAEPDHVARKTAALTMRLARSSLYSPELPRVEPAEVAAAMVSA